MLKRVFHNCCRKYPISNLRRNFLESQIKPNTTFSSLLNETDLGIVRKERILLDDLERVLRVLNSSTEDIDLIRDTKLRIDDLFLVVVVGEYNAGKSTFINSLLGSKFLKDGVLPTTDKIHIIRDQMTEETKGIWKKADSWMMDDVVEMNLPIKFSHVAIIDTPGTNAIISRHEQLSKQIIPRADLILFVTSAERPLSESESNFLGKITQWGKKIVVIVNKMDIFAENQEDRTEVLDYVQKNVLRLLQSSSLSPSTPVFGISSRDALAAKIQNQIETPTSNTNSSSSSLTTQTSLSPDLSSDPRWISSNLSQVEAYLNSVLGSQDVIFSKLQNPLLISDRILLAVNQHLKERSEVLESDRRILEMIDENMIVFKEDMLRDVNYLHQKTQSVLGQMMKRCNHYLEDHISILNPKVLFDSKAFQEDFSKEVLADLPQLIDDIVVDMSKIIAQRARMQARAVVEFVGSRPKTLPQVSQQLNTFSGQVSDSSIGNHASFKGSGREGGGGGGIAMIGRIQDLQFDQVRGEFASRMKRDATRVLQTHDQSNEVRRLTQELKSSYVRAAAMAASSVLSLGGLVSLQLFDITGLALTSTLAALGLFVVPWKRSQLRNEFQQGVTTLETQLCQVISNNFNSELTLVSDQILESVGPYSRFVRTEQIKIDKIQEELHQLKITISELNSQLLESRKK